jgi:hypothetical protein
VFLVNPPIIALVLLFVRRLPGARSAGGQRLDVAGALLITASLGALIFGLSNGQQHGFTSPATLAALAVAVALAAGFVVAERTVSAPMLPAVILASRTRRSAVMAMLLIGAVLAGYVSGRLACGRLSPVFLSRHGHGVGGRGPGGGGTRDTRRSARRPGPTDHRWHRRAGDGLTRPTSSFSAVPVVQPGWRQTLQIPGGLPGRPCRSGLGYFRRAPKEPWAPSRYPSYGPLA